VLFRQILALITRKDQGPNRGIGRQGRLTLTWAAWQFLRGTGDVPRLHAALPAVTFEQIVQRKGAWPSDADMVLERYYRVKLESYQFFGRPNFDLPFWDGLESLILTYPAIGWLTRALHDRSAEDALTQALQIVDDSFGFHPLLATSRQKLSLRILSSRGQIAHLVAFFAD
jgi:lysine-N-methylase